MSMKPDQTSVVCLDKEKGIYSGLGLIDLQVNGINGVDFNGIDLAEDAVLKASEYLLSKGVTAYCPTIITGSDEKVTKILRTIVRSMKKFPLVRAMVLGIHLEGPFLSPEDGARGAHDIRYIKAPDWNLVQRFQDIAEGNIILITMAPEWKGSAEFIGQCRSHGILISIGHTMANTEDIENAVAAGACLSTHLGNAVPLMLPRHPNMIWDQLADDDLYAMIITDGHHIPDSFIRVVMKVKGEKTIVVSDATMYAGLPPGEYKSTIGGTVLLSKDNKLSMKGGGGLLAGAAKDLLQNVETLIRHRLASIEQAWDMASTRVSDLLKRDLSDYTSMEGDRVEFEYKSDKIVIKRVFKSGNLVFES